MLRLTRILFAFTALAICGLPARAEASVQWGVNLPNFAADNELAAFDQLVGVKPPIVMWYQQWSEPIVYATQLPTVRAVGAVPMITWDPSAGSTTIPLSSIVRGDWDAYIRTSAQTIAAFGHRVYIRFAHEMNLPASPFGPGRDHNTAPRFVAAWQHVVAIFRAQGASNVAWVWSPNNNCDGACPFAAFYPGDEWVDDVALDGYNYGEAHNDPWHDLGQIFGPSYAQLEALTSKPVILAETASSELGGSKANWITRGLLDEIPHDFPNVRAVIWFDHQDNPDGDLRVNSSPASLAAFRSVVSNPLYFSPPPVLTPPVTKILGVSTRATRVTMTATSSSPRASYQCRVDESEWADCRSTSTFTQLAAGNHRLTIRATSVQGNLDPVGASTTVAVTAASPYPALQGGLPHVTQPPPSVARSRVLNPGSRSAPSASLGSMFLALAHGDVKKLQSQLKGMGALAVLALVALVLAHTVLPFPAEILAAAGGFALGFALALPVLLASFFVSALIAYLVGALAGRPLTVTIIGARRLENAERLIARGGWRALLAVRVIPLIPFSPVCFTCGLTAVPLRRYMWTTAVGILPELAIVTYLGSRLQSLQLADPAVWSTLAGVLILLIIVPRLLRHRIDA